MGYDELMLPSQQRVYGLGGLRAVVVGDLDTTINHYNADLRSFH